VPLAQVPAEQVAPVMQALLQVPQWVALVPRLASQPLLGSPSQLPKPVVQVKPQVPPVQVVVALARVGHTVEQPPQLPTSVWRLRHAPLQAVRPVEHAITQLPAEQYSSEPHTRPQAPQ